MVKEILKCAKCKKDFKDVEGFNAHNKECKSYGYTVIKDFSIAKSVARDYGPKAPKKPEITVGQPSIPEDTSPVKPELAEPVKEKVKPIKKSRNKKVLGK